MKYLAIRHFRDFQHYDKDKRNAPWMKLYTALLTDPQFIQMPEAAQAQLVKLWLLTTAMGYPLPNSPKLLAGKIGSTGKFFLQTFIELGFFTPCNSLAECEQIASKTASRAASKTASTALAESFENASELASELASGSARADARSRERLELELEREEEQTTTTAVVAFDADAVAQRLPTDADRRAYARLMAVAAQPDTWRDEILASLDAMAGHHATTPAQMGEAIRDYIGNGDAKNRSLRQFRRYIEQASKPREASRRKEPANAGEASYAAGRAALEDL